MPAFRNARISASVVAQLAEHDVRVLAEERRRGADRRRRPLEREREPDLVERSEHRVLDPDVHGEGLRLRRGECLGDVEDRAAGNLRCLERCLPFRAGPRRRRSARSGRRTSRLTTRSPFEAKRGSAASAGTPSASQNRTHWRSDPTATDEPPIGGFECLVRNDVRVRVAVPSGRSPADERVLRLVDEHRQGRGEERHVDPLSRPGAVGQARIGLPALQQRGEHGDRPEQPAHDVADRDPDLGRLAAVAVRCPGDRHEPARRLNDGVVAGPFGVGAVGPVARDRQVDESRVDPAQLGLVEPEPRKAADPEVLDDDVGTPEQPPQDVLAGFGAQVDAHAALVAVHRQEIGGGSGARLLGTDPRRAPGAGRVALGWLHLDDLGPEVGEEHRAQRAGKDRRAVGNDEAGKRPARRSPRSSMVGITADRSADVPQAARRSRR